MNFKDCIKFANENPVCSVATIENNKPRVRFIQMDFADDTGFYFQTEATKALCNQLKNDGRIEVSFIASKLVLPQQINPDEKATLRVTGEVEFIDDLEIKTKIFKNRPYLKDVGIEKPEDSLMVVFRIHTGEAFSWSLKDSCKESQIPRIHF